MAFDAYADGNILTAGSLNTSLNRRTIFHGIITGGAAVSGTAYTTIRDTYITSGTFVGNAKLYVPLTTYGREWNDASAQVYIIGVGPSGTSFTADTSGVLTYLSAANANGIESNYGILHFIGSTTWDSATVPALIRITANSTGNNTGSAFVADCPMFQI